ncbi:hypothetical protein [Devosia rhizoryzae]|uniref:DUF5330 domain-containing protein n=1 Tax=Devosia rhizoryzae TaxID=2774137 RepID=A0ABX7C7P0_9HYPH|nr:hypothetical protein [Devosia rhizoryzae]QQR37976.1 hypothetical protein JI748_09180 [Devosia rhizoryzae]
MFLLRSAFWLTLAFVLIRPEIDVRDTAESLSNEALAQGGAFISEQISAIDCTELVCHGGKALAVAALQNTQQAGDPMHTTPAKPAIPLPRPRPDRPV